MNDKLKKYAKLLLDCVDLKSKKYLYLEIPNYLNYFKDIIVSELKNYDLIEYYIDEVDFDKKHNLLLNCSEEELYNNPIFDNSIKNKYALLDAAFLFIHSNIPGLMDDVDPEKIKKINIYSRNTESEFRKYYENNKLNWTIAGAANEMWAKSINMTLEELWNYIFDICFINETKDPYFVWKDYLGKLEEKVNILNKYNFKYLSYSNKKGTSLKVYLPKNHIWECCGESKNIVNMPSLEIFTSPLYNKTEGIVYSTKPLIYNNVLIDDFWIKFKDGKVDSFDAKCGYDVLKGIIENDSYSCYLGECSLVSFDSKINNTGIIFKDTLFDENASCHLALGSGFNECVLNGNDKRGDDLRNLGVNDAKIHVDFMVGHETMKIVGITYDDNEVLIMENGNLVI